MLTRLKKWLPGLLPDSKNEARLRQRRIDPLAYRFLRVKLNKAGLTERALCQQFKIKRMRSLRMHQLEEAAAWIVRHL